MSADDLPEPFVPADCDVSMLDGFMLNVKRLFASELLAIATPDECWAAFLLWCRAWQQVPGGSLPNDERKLAGFSNAGARWKKIRENALHGFVLCSDGRLYHRYLCEEVRRAHKSHMDYQARRETDKKRLAEWRAKRDGNGAETTTETDSETRFVELETRQDKTRQKLASKHDSERLPREWAEAAAAERTRAGLPEVDLAAEWARFLAKTGDDPSLGRWLGWMRKARVSAPDSKSRAGFGLPEAPWEQRCRSWAKGHRWDPMWGPEPGEAGCGAPKTVADEAVQKRASVAAAAAE